MLLWLLEDCGACGYWTRFFCQCGPGPPRIPCIFPFTYCFPCCCFCYCGEVRCTECHSSNVGYIWWGENLDACLDPVTNDMIGKGEIILGGGNVNSDSSTHQCNECGERFNGYPLWMRCCCRGTCPF